MASSGLITKNVLNLSTDIGTCQIDLCVGDITKLEQKDKVDVIVVSAFPGDYSPTPSSLIGQLQIQLGISVQNLSKDKEEDLREQYFCWWSKLLPNHLSYGRLLCFEGGFGSHATSPPKVIGAIFRCLVPILKNKEGSVIMPLITAGDQGFSQDLVLKQILIAADNWIKAGLPLRNLKIVIFSKNPLVENMRLRLMLDVFEKFKAEPVQETINLKSDGSWYDIYISHCQVDHPIAQQLKRILEQRGLKVFDDVQELNAQESWQGSMYHIMVKCSCVVVLLTPHYLASENCIEQFNMALCISRRNHIQVIAINTQNIESLPRYMRLMRNIDCRSNNNLKLKRAADTILHLMQRSDVRTVSINGHFVSKGPHQPTFKSYTEPSDSVVNFGVQVTEEKVSYQETGSYRPCVETSNRLPISEPKTPTEQDDN